MNRIRKRFRPSGFRPCATRRMTGSPTPRINLLNLWKSPKNRKLYVRQSKGRLSTFNPPLSPPLRRRRIPLDHPAAAARSCGVAHRSSALSTLCSPACRPDWSQYRASRIGRRWAVGRWGGARDRNSTIELSAKVRWCSATLIR